jgi:hypothetical protein
LIEQYYSDENSLARHTEEDIMVDQITKKPPQQSISEYKDMAKNHLVRGQKHLQRLAEANKPSDQTYSATGEMTFATAFIYGTISAKLTFDSGETVCFDATAWGIGLGAGISWGGAWFNVSPSQLMNSDASVQCVVGGGVIEATWWWGNRVIGGFIGGGIDVGVTDTGGSGSFTKC